MRSARCSTIPTCVAVAVVGDGEAETGPLKGSWKSIEVPEPGARRRGAADPAPEWLQDLRPDRARARRPTATSASCSSRTATRCTSSRATIRLTVHRRVRDRARPCYHEHPRYQDERAQAAPRGRLAGDRAAHAEGVDRPEGRATASQSRARSARTRCRSPASATNPRALEDARSSGCAATSRRSCSTSDGRLRAGARRARAEGRAADGRQPARQRRQAARRPRSARLPRVRGAGDEARRRAARVDAPARQDAARRLQVRAQRRTSASSAPTRPTRTASATSSRSRTAALGAGAADRRSRRHRRPGDGGAERAPLPGLARGLSADRPPRAVRDLRGVRDGVGVDDHAARQVAGGRARARLAQADRVAQLPAHLDLLAQRPQRLQPSGPGADRRRCWP